MSNKKLQSKSSEQNQNTKQNKSTDSQSFIHKWLVSCHIIMLIAISVQFFYINHFPQATFADLLKNIILTYFLTLTAMELAYIGIRFLAALSRQPEVVNWYYRYKIEKLKQLSIKNFGSLYPMIGKFLYLVMTKNNDTLNLPLKTDEKCLTPFKCDYEFRCYNSFYIYELIYTGSDNWDLKGLREILNLYIAEELRNNGIADGIAWYSIAGQYIDSVYVDDIYLTGKSICFKVLYISNPTAAAYYLNRKAWEENKENFVPEDLYDDDLKLYDSDLENKNDRYN